MNETKDNDLEAFRQMVKLFIEIDSPATISNNNSDHAKIILEELFRSAKETAYVYCGHISNEVWGGDTMAAVIDRAVRNNVKVRFIVQKPNEIPKDSAVAAFLKERNLICSSEKFSALGTHFAVFDGKRYRLEKNDEAKSATVCMCNEASAGKLKETAELMINAAA